jgi:hypothetical protein
VRVLVGALLTALTLAVLVSLSWTVLPVQAYPTSVTPVNPPAPPFPASAYSVDTDTMVQVTTYPAGWTLGAAEAFSILAPVVWSAGVVALVLLATFGLAGPIADLIALPEYLTKVARATWVFLFPIELAIRSAITRYPRFDSVFLAQRVAATITLAILLALLHIFVVDAAARAAVLLLQDMLRRRLWRCRQ